LSDVHAWIEILKGVESMDADTFVPDEGPPGSKDDLMEFREFLEWLAREMEPSRLPENPKGRGKTVKMAKVQE